MSEKMSKAEMEFALSATGDGPTDNIYLIKHLKDVLRQALEHVPDDILCYVCKKTINSNHVRAMLIKNMSEKHFCTDGCLAEFNAKVD